MDSNWNLWIGLWNPNWLGKDVLSQHASFGPECSFNQTNWYSWLAGESAMMCRRKYGKVDSVALCLKSKSAKTVIIICNQPVSNSLAIWSGGNDGTRRDRLSQNHLRAMFQLLWKFNWEIFLDFSKSIAGGEGGSKAAASLVEFSWCATGGSRWRRWRGRRRKEEHFAARTPFVDSTPPPCGSPSANVGQ